MNSVDQFGSLNLLEPLRGKIVNLMPMGLGNDPPGRQSSVNLSYLVDIGRYPQCIFQDFYVRFTKGGVLDPLADVLWL